MNPLAEMGSAADRLGISLQRTYELARRGVIPAVRLGRRWKVDMSRLESWIAGGGAALPGGWRAEETES